MLVAFLISDAPGLVNVWTVGFIPMFTGVGFLLYVLLSVLWPPLKPRENSVANPPSEQAGE